MPDLGKTYQFSGGESATTDTQKFAPVAAASAPQQKIDPVNQTPESVGDNQNGMKVTEVKSEIREMVYRITALLSRE